MFKISIVHEWFINFAGSEQVVSSMLNVFCDADLYALVDFLTDNERAFIRNKEVKTSFLQYLPLVKKKYKNYLFFMPLAVEQLDVTDADVIISSSHAVAKGVLTGPDQLHISYVHSPIRYAWDLQHQYLHEAGLEKGLKSLIARYILHKMRIWDYRTANGVDYFVANSQFIARRIKKVYGRESTVIYPPVSVNDFTCTEVKSDYYLTASRMVPYKKMDLIVKAFTKMPDKKLIVIGTGSEFDKINKIASKYKNVEMMGYQPFSVLKEKMEKAKAFVFAAEEDFGIIPVEAQACGTPVIAFGKGGALETVRPLGVEHPTGVFFEKQDSTSLIEAIQHFENNIDQLSANNCRINAEKFSKARFESEFKTFVEEKWNLFQEEKKVKY